MNDIREGGAAAFASLRREAREAPESGIVEVFNYGRDRQGLIPLWVGEGDLPTPDFIRAAAAKSLADGETFYTHQRGAPELRAAIAAYFRAHYAPPAGAPDYFTPERFFVTIGGMHALQIAVRLVCGDGDEAIVVTPAWPNFGGAIIAAGARPVEVPMDFAVGGWSVDIDRVAAAITPATRALMVNTPSNPTGWVATPQELAALLDLARRHGLWLVADEIYGRLTYDGRRAPSFRDVMDADDRVLFVQTFSKNWAMTGWRVGWLEAPPAFGPTIENLVQYSTSGVPVFVQRAATAAISEGEPFLAAQIERMKASRDIVTAGLAATGRATFATPHAAFYLFARFHGHADTRRLALDLVDEANVGVAPGAAFGRGGEQFVRICFARGPDEMAEATRRLARWLGRQG